MIGNRFFRIHPMKAFHLFVFAAVLPLASCDKIKEAAGNTADAALERAKEQVKQELKATIEDTELMKSGREYAEKAKSALGTLNLDKLRGEVEQVKVALENGDYAAAEKLSGSVDKFLDTKLVGDTVELMKIRAEQGTEAAQRKLTETLALPDLAPEQKAYLEKLKGRIANFNAQDQEEATRMLILSVVASAESKIGHGGEAVMWVIDKVFPGTSEKLVEEIKVEAEK